MSQGARKNKFQFYLNRMHRRSFTTDQVLKNTGLSKEEVFAGAYNATPHVYRCIISNMLRLTENPRLGIDLGFEFKISDLGMLGYAALSSATVAQVRAVIQRYHSLNEYILVPSNYIVNGRWYCELVEPFPLGKLLPFAVEEFVSRVIALTTTLTDRPFPILEMHLAYPRPENSELYEETYQCPIYYNKRRTQVLFDKERLQDPIIMADEEVFAICEHQCRSLIRQQEYEHSLQEKIQQILINMPGKFPSMEKMAERLRISTRTLRRQLGHENASYQEIIDSTREGLALQYLAHTHLVPKEIAYLLGYNNVSNFRRAFKRWTGKRVSDYR